MLGEYLLNILWNLSSPIPNRMLPWSELPSLRPRAKQFLRGTTLSTSLWRIAACSRAVIRRVCRSPGRSIPIEDASLPANIVTRAIRMSSWRCATVWSFERKIYVKQHSAWLLRQELKQVRAGQSIAIGTATDPYQPAERRFGITRAVMEGVGSA